MRIKHRTDCENHDAKPCTCDYKKRFVKAMLRKEKNDVMKSLGLTKVKGAVSGKTYWE